MARAVRADRQTSDAPDPRWPLILRERLITGRTLDSIGTELGLTRERVRQLEAALRSRLADSAFIGLVIDGVGRRIHPFEHVTEVLAAVPSIPGIEERLVRDMERWLNGWLRHQRRREGK